METRAEQPEIPAPSLQVALGGGAPDRIPAVQSGQGLQPQVRPALSLISGTQLVLSAPAETPPADWTDGMKQLAAWLELDISEVPARSIGALRQVTAWARPGAAGSVAPVFAPWQSVASVAFQAGGAPGLPRAQWVASYLHDLGTGKPLKASSLDVMLMSAHPAACPMDEDCGAPLPRADVMQAMLRAAHAEGRSRIAIVVDAQRRNAIVRQMLIHGRSHPREEQEIEILPIEDALCHLVRHAGRWDAIIVLPDLRSLIFAVLAEITGIWTPWPMLWHARGLSQITGEVLDESENALPLNAPLLVQTLALAAQHAGLGHAAQRLMQGAAQIWGCGIITPGRGSVAPYVTEMSDRDFIHQLCRGARRPARRKAGWRAIPSTMNSTAPRPSRPMLRVVANGEE